MNAPLWQPSRNRIRQAQLTAFISQAEEDWDIRLGTFAALYRWSIREPEAFWISLWDFGAVVAESRGEPALENPKAMPGARWFPQARLNFAENLLRRHDETDAVVYRAESGVQRRLSWAELHDQVSQLAQALRAAGVSAEDRVAGYLPALPEAVSAMLAGASFGAIWSACPPELGTAEVVSCLEQIAPKVLVVADGYLAAGQTHDLLGRVREIVERLPSVERVVVVPCLNEAPALGEIRGAVLLDEFIAAYEPTSLVYESLPFEHPLYIVFSAAQGTPPRPLVHGAGGTLLQHLKEQLLHCDIKAEDRVCVATTCGTCMWNWQVSALAAQATLLLYDGSPLAPHPGLLFDYADAEAMTFLALSSEHLASLQRAGLKPRETHALAELRCLAATGTPLAPEGFDYVYQRVKADLHVAALLGCDELMSCFALGNPLGPVWRGETQTRGLGMQVEVFDEQGRPARRHRGALACVAPFPALPLGLWNDPEHEQYQATFFSGNPPTWPHGQSAEITEHDGLIIHGRAAASSRASSKDALVD